MTDNLSDMLVDEYETYNNERQEVHDFAAGDLVEDTGKPSMADDIEAIKDKVLPRDLVQVADQEIAYESHHTWHIDKWRSLGRKEHGPVFECGGSPWRVLFFPFGNNVDFASLYLEHGFEDKPPEDWYACIHFAVILWNPADPSIYAHHQAVHRFNATDGDWGFTRFVELRKAFNPWEGRDRALVENEEVKITTMVRVYKDPTGVLWHTWEGYDSKKETGMVGLKNQGATCYLNSLLQSLYFTNSFRKAVYGIPTASEAVRTNKAWTLQRLFYNLQRSKDAVSTSELTASFGWETRQIFEQQDVQELARILMDKLEERMKGSSSEKALSELFAGKYKTYISCINVDFESSKIEDFWDIQLNVRGHKNLHESFMHFIEVEIMEGDNKYDAGDLYKLQDARKGIIFLSFPPVLHIQLRRFAYDVGRDATMKINDHHEFPEEFDAAPYLSDDADKSESWVYQLHGVLVHSGDFNAGHYYAFLKPEKEGFFYRFDDDRVNRCTMKETLEENYGGEYANLANGSLGHRQPYMRGLSTKRSMNAYMLVYIRKTQLDNVLVPVKEDDIPVHIEKQMVEEQEMAARIEKEKAEEKFYITVGVISDDTYRNHHTFDMVDWDCPPDLPSTADYHRLLKTTTISEFAVKIAEEKQLSPEQVRFWVMVNRQNKTSRPDQPLRDGSMTIDEGWNKYGTKGIPFRLWAETCKLEDGKPTWPTNQAVSGAGAPILVFLKSFDVQAQSLTGVGHFYVNKLTKVMDVCDQIMQLMGWEPGTKMNLYEEIRHSMVEPLKARQTFQQSEIQDGDIICVQRVIENFDTTSVMYPEARKYYDYLLNRVQMKFSPRISTGAEDEVFSLPLSKKMTYDQLSVKVGEQLKVHPTHLRFATVHRTTLKPRAWVKRTLSQTIHAITSTPYGYGPTQNSEDHLCYEVLETSLADFETKKLVKPIWLSEGISKEEAVDVLVPKNGSIADVITALTKKLSLEPATAPLRVYEAHASRIYKELTEESPLAGINDFVKLYAERVPDEELHAADDDQPIFCFHFDKEISKSHGTPFKFMIKPGELFKDTRERLSKRTGIKGKLLENVKFAIVGRSVYTKPRYLEDDDIVHDLVGDPESCLGLDHVNKTKNFWVRSDSFFIK